MTKKEALKMYEDVAKINNMSTTKLLEMALGSLFKNNKDIKDYYGNKR